MGRELEETEPHRIKNAQRQKPSRVEVSKTDPHPSASDTWRVLFGPWKLISSSRAHWGAWVSGLEFQGLGLSRP